MAKALKRERDLARYAANKTAMNEARARNMRAQRLRLAEQIKNGPCMDCGRLLPPWMLDLDHRDPTTKLTAVAGLLAKGTVTPELAAELAKCDLVCAVCHGYRTRVRSGHATDEDIEFWERWTREGRASSFDGPSQTGELNDPGGL